MTRLVCVMVPDWGWLRLVAAQTPDVQKLLARSRPKTRASWPCPKRTAVPAADGRVERREARARDWRRQRLQRDLDRHGAARRPAARLVTIEYDPVRAKELAENIKRAGLSDIVQVVAGDAFAADSESAGHVRLRLPRRVEERLQALLRPGLSRGWTRAGCSSAHNVVNKRSEMGDFLDAIQKHPSLGRRSCRRPGKGMSVSLKR